VSSSNRHLPKMTEDLLEAFRGKSLIEYDADNRPGWTQAALYFAEILRDSTIATVDGDCYAALRRECNDLAGREAVSVDGCVDWPASALLAFKVLCTRLGAARQQEETADLRSVPSAALTPPQKDEQRRRLLHADMSREEVDALVRQPTAPGDWTEGAIPEAYKANCEGGTGGPCTQPDCEKCWPDEPMDDATGYALGSM
jgi:hypothetical protein